MYEAQPLDLEPKKKGKTKSALEPIVETVVYEMAGVSRDKAVAIKFDHNLGSLPEVYADANRVKQVIYNLIGNAMKFTEKGSVNVTAEVAKNLLKVYVTDTGLGISPEGQQLLFHSILAGPVREREETLIADLDLGDVLSARRHLDPVGHYHRPDIFRLYVDTSPRPPVVETRLAGNEPPPSTGEAMPAREAGS